MLKIALALSAKSSAYYDLSPHILDLFQNELKCISGNSEIFNKYHSRSTLNCPICLFFFFNSRSRAIN